MSISTTDPLGLLSTVQLEARTGISRWTWIKYRKQRKGPNWVVIGRAVRYRVPEIDAWLASNTVVPGDAGKPKVKPAPALVQNTIRQVPPHLRGMRGHS